MASGGHSKGEVVGVNEQEPHVKESVYSIVRCCDSYAKVIIGKEHLS